MNSISCYLKRKTIISFLFFLATFFAANAQNYKELSKMLYGSTSSQKEAKLRLVFEYFKQTELLTQFDRAKKELRSNLSIQDKRLIQFNKDYENNKQDDPKKSAACLDFKSYKRKYESQKTRVSKLNAMVSLARTALKLCQSSIYTKRNCSSQRNNYNRQVSLHNQAISLLNQYGKKGKYYLDACNRVINNYNRKNRNKSSYTTLFRAKEKELNSSLGITRLRNDYKQAKLAILKFLSSKSFENKEYYLNGKIRVIAQFSIISEKEMGSNIFYATDTNYFDYGKRAGTWKFYTDKGKLKTAVTYGKYEKVLKHIDYYSDGKKILKRKTYNGKNMLTEIFRPNGVLGSVTEYKKLSGSKYYVMDGKGTFYYKNGKINKVNLYKNNKLVAYWDMYLKDGKQVLKNGNGNYYEYDNFGNLTAINTIKNGGRDGLRTFYFSTGKIKMKALYKYNKKLSPFGLRWEVLVSYDRNGKSLKKGTLKNGNGSWNIYDDNGKLLRTSIYKNGYKVN